MTQHEEGTLTPPQQVVLDALQRIGGEGTTGDIARAAGKKGNGVAQVLGRLSQVEAVSGAYRGSGRRWRLRPPTDPFKGATEFLKGISP